jgi:hypothetical protein
MVKKKKNRKSAELSFEYILSLSSSYLNFHIKHHSVFFSSLLLNFGLTVFPESNVAKIEFL